MPIRFRCGYCNRLLGIARRKAGTETTCPHCGYTIIVPEDEAAADDATNLDEIDALLHSAAPAAAEESPAARAPAPKPATPAVRPPAPPPSKPILPPASPPPKPKAAGERPLFERDLDEVLGTKNAGGPPAETKPKAVPTSGMDALSLDDDGGKIVLSTQKATALAVAVVVLLAMSFAAGFLLASR